jgi:HEAT repeat protein/energy-coupling factor transporter ATP-binding protein EcfA2
MTDQNAFATQTENYLNACRKNFDRVEVDSETTVHIKDIFVMLQAIESVKESGAKSRSDLPELSDRLEKAGIVLEKSKETVSEKKQDEQRILPINTALIENQHLALLGEPGSGKSTVLKYVAYCFATTNMAKQELGFVETRIPILINLQKYAPFLAQPGAILENVLALEVSEVVQSDSESRQMVSNWREEGKLIILMDGLDEVSDDLRDKVKDQITKFINSPMAQHCRLILASRTAGFSTPTESLAKFTIRPIDNDEDVLIYFQHWLSVLRGELTSEEGSKLSANLFEEMKQHYSLRLVLDNPLLLRLSLQVYLEKKSVATNRTNLYDLWIENLWEKYVKRGGRPEDKNKIMDALEVAAWQLQNNLEIQVSEEINSLREKLGLLARYSNNIIFSHRTIQEYFVAKRVVRLYNENEDSFWAFMKTRLHAHGWREPILLLFGGLSRQQRISFIKKVLKAKSIHENILCRDLNLSLRLLNQVDTLFSGLGLKLTVKALRSRNPVERKVIVERLGETRDSRSTEYLLPKLKDIDKEVVEEVVGSLEKIKDEKAVPSLLELNKRIGHDLGWKIEKAIFRTSGSKAIRSTIESRKNNIGYSKVHLDEVQDANALIDILPSLDEFGRSQIARALGKNKSDQAYVALVKLLYDNEEKVREESVKALGELGNRNAITDILNSADHFELHYEHASALEKLSTKDDLPVFRKILLDKNMSLAWISCMVLGNLKDYESGKDILDLLNFQKDEHEVHYFAISALGELRYKPAISKLLELASVDLSIIHGDEYQSRQSLKGYAIEALGEIRDPSALPVLLKALNENSMGYYWHSKEAADAIAKIGDVTTIPELVDKLSHLDLVMNKDVIEFLAANCDTEYLVEHYDCPERFHRINTLRVLDEKKDPSSELIIEKALRDPDALVRGHALTLAKTIKAENLLNYLTIGLTDENYLIRYHALKDIQDLGEASLLPQVSNLLDDENSIVRSSAPWALVMISDGLAKSCGDDLEKKQEALKWLRFSATELAKRHKWDFDLVEKFRIPIANKARDKSAFRITSKVFGFFNRMLNRKYNIGQCLEFVVGYMTSLSVTYTDPFVKLPPSKAWRYIKFIGIWGIVCSVMVVLGYLTIFSDMLIDIVKAQWQSTLQTWLTTQPGWTLFTLLTLSFLMAGLVAILYDWIKSLLQNK